MTWFRRTLRWLVPLPLLAVLAAGCDSGERESGASDAGAGSARVAAANSPRAALRAELTGLLEEEVFLLALARRAPSLEGAWVGALASNVSELAQTLDESHAGLGRPIPEIWPRLLRVDLLATPPESPLAIGEAATATGDAVEAFDTLPVDEQRLRRTLSEFATAIRAPTGDEPQRSRQLAAAVADLIATAIAREHPLDFPAPPDARAADLRVRLSSIFRAGTYSLVERLVDGAPSDHNREGPVPTFAAEGAALSTALEPWTDATTQPLGTAWSAYFEALVAGARAPAERPGDAAIAGIEAPREALARQFASIDDEIATSAIERSLREFEARIRTLPSLPDADPDAALRRTRDAADFQAALARYLSVAVTRR